ncbi:MAG: ATP-binding protein, partial [Mycobacteriaceae bacterium]|nr:ATP-binding protein [Mycobacteriaceae bacterium]
MDDTSANKASRAVDIGGDAAGPVIAGDYNVVIDAKSGSQVSLLTERRRPEPVRRKQIELLPRAQSAPIGREAALAALNAAVRQGGSVQLSGPTGSGKSALLRHAARTAPAGPDGVIFLSAATREADDLAQEIFEACYDADGYAPSRSELRRLMKNLRVTVYLDDADLELRPLRDLTDAAPEATFVFTAERRVPLDDLTVIEVEGLTEQAWRRLLERTLNRPVPAAAHAEVERLRQAADGRPLVLQRAAALAAFDTSGALVLPQAGRIADLVPLLIDQLDAAPAAVLGLLATMAGADLSVVHIAALTDAADAEAEAACSRLVELGLAEPTEHGYQCHPDIVAAFRARHPDPFPVDALCAHFVRWLPQPSTTRAEVAAAARALERTAQLAAESGRDDQVVQLIRAGSPAMARALRFGMWGRLLGRGWIAAQKTGDRSAAAYFMHEEGIRSLLTGRRVLAAALLAEAALVWKELGNLHAAQAAQQAQQFIPDAPPPSAPPVS